MIVSKLNLFILCLHQPVIAASRSPNKNTAAKPKSPIRAEQTNGKAGPVQGTGSADSAEVKGHRLELMMKFVCGQCWKDGLLSEPDRALKYCTAKARHRCRRTDGLTQTPHLNTHKPSHSLPLSVSLQLDQRQKGFTGQVSREEEVGHSATCAFCQDLSSTIRRE